MRHFGEPFRRQAAHIISALVWRTVEERRYEITQEGEQQQMEVFPAYATGTFWSVAVELYPSDPFAAELLHLKVRFDDALLQWRKERNPLSSNAWDNVLNPGYQRIIGMGKDALPFILQELRRELKNGEPDDWFMALWAITDGENLIPVESRGKVKEMAKAWLEWGSRSGYINGEALGGRVSAFGRLGMP
jgi:hypothetical protein